MWILHTAQGFLMASVRPHLLPQSLGSMIGNSDFRKPQGIINTRQRLKTLFFFTRLPATSTTEKPKHITDKLGGEF